LAVYLNPKPVLIFFEDIIFVIRCGHAAGTTTGVASGVVFTVECSLQALFEGNTSYFCIQIFILAADFIQGILQLYL